jgi:hypothetical protein
MSCIYNFSAHIESSSDSSIVATTRRCLHMSKYEKHFAWTRAEYSLKIHLLHYVVLFQDSTLSDASVALTIQFLTSAMLLLLS